MQCYYKVTKRHYRGWEASGRKITWIKGENISKPMEQGGWCIEDIIVVSIVLTEKI